MEAYYYSQMNKNEQSIYHAMKTGFTALSSTITLPAIDGKGLQDIFMKLRLDCPEIFYVVGYRYRHVVDASHIEMLPEYLFNKKKVKENQQAMNARIGKLVRQAEHLTEYQKELFIHDFICQLVQYDKLKKPYSHEIIGPLGQGVGVCEGIAKTVKVLCDRLGIWCVIVISEANPDKQIKYRHAWNVIKIEGVYYHLDTTFNNTLSDKGKIRYDYFNLDDKQIFKDHEPVIYAVPACNEGKRSYYREQKLSFTKVEEVNKRAQQAIRKGTPFSFQWRGGHLTREVLLELIEVLEQSAQKRNRHVSISVNRQQSVLHLKFTERLQEDVLTNTHNISVL